MPCRCGSFHYYRQTFRDGECIIGYQNVFWCFSHDDASILMHSDDVRNPVAWPSVHHGFLSAFLPKLLLQSQILCDLNYFLQSCAFASFFYFRMCSAYYSVNLYDPWWSQNTRRFFQFAVVYSRHKHFPVLFTLSMCSWIGVSDCNTIIFVF